MYFKRSLNKVILNNKSFLLFLISYGIMNIGDSFNFISITALLIKITGTGLYAGFNIICTPIASILFSSFAGSIGDRFNEKYLIVFLDLFRTVTIFLFIINTNINIIYLLILVLSSLEVISSPSRKKLIVSILKGKELIKGNSLLSGITGIVFIIAPLLAGFIISLWGTNVAFAISTLLSFISTSIIIFIKRTTHISIKLKDKYHIGKIYNDIIKGFKYYKKTSAIKELIVMSTIVYLCTASINMAFYPFSFDVLKVTSKGWGIMMSIFYGANLFAMFITLYINKHFKKIRLSFFYYILFITSVTWFYYSIVNKLSIVLALQFTEGILLSIFTIFFNTKLQTITRKDFVARIIAINDIINNIGKLFSITFTYILIKYFKSLRLVFVINSILILFYLISKNKLFQLQSLKKKL